MRSDTIKAWLIALVALAVAAWLMTKLLDPKDLAAQPFERSTTAGQAVGLRTAEVKLVSVDASKKIVVPRQTDTDGVNTGISGNGVFLVPTIEIRGRGEAASLGNLSIKTKDGRTFGGLQAIGGNGCGTAPPDLPIRCQLVFEIDKAALAGARLHVPASNSKADDVAVIDLGISDARARELGANEAIIRILPAEAGWAVTP